jgi:N-methylhydantoinase B/oxoprolinase/acetone carboxylase alpha subunit|tara:strand:+ start:160 stop:486 length:327 start_codon:yes stop_codon:yes gene_type:complete
MALNYTEEQVSTMIQRYKESPARETVELLAQDFNKSVKSIIGKLSREGVYKKTEYVTKAGEKPVTKSQLVLSIAEELEEDYESFKGLDKAPKEALKVLLEKIEEIKCV